MKISIKIVFIVLFMSGWNTLLFSSLQSGSQLWYSGFNAGINGQGYGGIGTINSGFHSFINPAASAFSENIRFFSSGNISSPEWGGSFGISTPTDPGGTLYAGSQHLSFDNTTTTHMGYGKKVRSDLAFGMEGLLTIHPDALKNSVGGGLSLGVIWNPVDPLPIKNGWGFSRFSLGSVFKTVFYPTTGTCDNTMPMILLQLGINATFMEYKYARWGFNVDYSLGFVPLTFKNGIHLQTWAAFGTTLTIGNIWDISVGAILGNHGLGFGSNPLLPYSFGTALGYEWSHFSFKVFYRFGGHEFFEVPEYIHTVGVELGIGSKKITNIGIQLTTKNHRQLTNYFSPNDDLVQDTVTFLLNVTGSQVINAWRLIILDQSGSIVRSFEAEEKSIDDSFHIGTFFYNYFVPDKKHNIPSQIVWDGKDQNGKVLKDGTYTATLMVRYQENKNIVSMVNTLIVDTQAPTARVRVINDHLYLGDNPEEKLIIHQELSWEDPWSAKLIDNTDKRIIEQWFWKVGESPKTNQWGLANPKRINVANGSFSYVVSSYDQAGNFTEFIIDNINIETIARKPLMTSKQQKFSPNNDGFLDVLPIEIDFSVQTGLIKSCLVIYNESGNRIYNSPLDTKQNKISWDGKSKNNTVPDGNYVAVLEQHYIDKQMFSSPPILIAIDSTPPRFETKFSPQRFSPDGDEIDDWLIIDFIAKDIHNISNWTIIIRDEQEKIKHQFSGDEEKKTLVWTPKRNSIKSQELLFFEINIQDTLGNKIQAVFHELRVDTLTDPIDKNLILTQNKGIFETGQSIISGGLFDYLNEIASYYQYQKKDKIKILSQAYTAEADNSQFAANKLGLERANAIKAYLINQKIPEANIEMEILIHEENNPKKQSILRQPKIYLQKIF